MIVGKERKQHSSLRRAAFIALAVLACVNSAVNAFAPTNSADHGRLSNQRPTASSSSLQSSSDLHSEPSLNVCVVGGGPCGLLLSHLLLKQPNVQVSLIEGRSDPRAPKPSDSRAYALGIGIRGRTAIRAVDEELWQRVKDSGFESERFQLHVGPFVVPLRSEKDGRGGANSVEPSVLLFQTSLCGALVDELERRHGDSGRLDLAFDCDVTKCDLKTMEVSCKSKSGNDDDDTKKGGGPFDMIIGCDGVNSIVRQSIDSEFEAFETSRKELPGEFKVVKLDKIPSNVDPLAVSLVLPKAGRATAFVEPTDKAGECCILFAGKSEDPLLSNTQNVTALTESLMTAFPKWDDDIIDDIAKQLLAQKQTGSASSVTCNTYNYGGKAALAGDAAHATGGVSGQGVNSALQDSVALADAIRNTRDNLPNALLAYSKRQVPEGKALFDLSFGPKPTGLQGFKLAFMNARDTLLRGRFGIGRPPLQTRLTTSLESFVDIRREKDKFYDDEFPSTADFENELEKLHEEGLESAKTNTILVD